MIQSATANRSALPKASIRDTLSITTGVFLPTIAKGPIIRRPRIVHRAERKDLDAKAVQRLQRMRERYGNGPLMLRVPGRNQAVTLAAQHVRRILEQTPEPFATASTEKQAALAHFEPRVSLISHGPEREARRRLNEQTLEDRCPVHHIADAMLPVVDEEARYLLNRVEKIGGELRYDDFYEAWFRVVRRIVFGDAARDDTEITELMETLRSHGNWAFLRPKRTDLRNRLHERIAEYLDKSEPGSLSAIMAEKAKATVQEPENQIPQWLFAFDPAVIATHRALGLLATHADMMDRARSETRSGSAVDMPQRPFLRAAVLESLRLWPTTPMVLRQTTRETQWENGIMPEQTGILIFAPYFHRDEARIPFAHSFNPDVWIEDDPQVQGDMPTQWPFIPFSGGTGRCPGRNVVLLLTSGMLAALIGERQIAMKDANRLDPSKPLPGTLDNHTMRFEMKEGVRTSARQSIH